MCSSDLTAPSVLEGSAAPGGPAAFRRVLPGPAAGAPGPKSIPTASMRGHRGGDTTLGAQLAAPPSVSVTGAQGQPAVKDGKRAVPPVPAVFKMCRYSSLKKKHKSHSYFRKRDTGESFKYYTISEASTFDSVSGHISSSRLDCANSGNEMIALRGSSQ